MKEIWRPIFGYEGTYEVSSLGNVRSLDRYVERPASKRCQAHTVFLPGKRLRPGIGTNGYYLVVLCQNGIKRQFMVHHLVADTFLNRQKHPNLVINHINGDKTDNRLSNLELVTIQENAAHARATGLVKVGYESPKAKLTLDQVREIQKLKRLGWSNPKLGEIYNVSATTICRASHYVFK